MKITRSGYYIHRFIAGILIPGLLTNATVLCQPGIEDTKETAKGPLRLIGVSEYKKPLYFKNTVAGGISGIDMAPDGLFYMISDAISDSVPSRFYTVELNYNDKSFDLVRFTGVIFLKTPSHKLFPTEQEAENGGEREIANAESIRYNRPANTLFWTSEGLNDLQGSPVQPFIRQMDLKGDFISEVKIPAEFRYKAEGKTGLRTNAAFESLCFVPGTEELLTATEAPLIQDGSRPDFFHSGSPVRIIRINRKTGKLIAQYAYIPDKTPVEPVPQSAGSFNGVSEILDIDSGRFLVLERSFSAGHETGKGNSIRLYEIDLSSAATIDGDASLMKMHFIPVAKKLVLDFSRTELDNIDNIEGMCWGKQLPDGKKSMVFVSDNNFSKKQVFQILVFEVDPDLL